MTFTEAAVEVLRRAGKPLHYREIAEQAVRENLLSHVGQDPEVTMGQRLAAMAKRDEERKVIAVAPEGTFALVEWSVPAEQVVDAVAPSLHPDEEGTPLYRPREREPRPIHAQARRRMEALQGGEEEEERKRDRGQRRFPPPAEVVFEWLAQRQSGAPIPELSDALFKKNLLSEALVRDPQSLVQALLEDNRRRTEAGRKPAFIVDGERVTLVEFPPPSALPEEARPSQTGLGRPMTAAQLVASKRQDSSSSAPISSRRWACATCGWRSAARKDLSTWRGSGAEFPTCGRRSSWCGGAARSAGRTCRSCARTWPTTARRWGWCWRRARRAATRGQRHPRPDSRRSRSTRATRWPRSWSRSGWA